jgi:hypothetical protein
MHALIVQAMVIHLDTRGGLPPEFFAPKPGSRGSVFDFQDEPQAVKL